MGLGQGAKEAYFVAEVKKDHGLRLIDGLIAGINRSKCTSPFITYPAVGVDSTLG